MTMTALVHDTTRDIGKCHTVIHAHGQFGVLFLKDAAELDEVGTTTQMAGLGEVAIGEDVAGAQMNEVGAGSELLG